MDIPWPYTRILHYSPTAIPHRRTAARQENDAFEAFRETISGEDVIEVARQALEASEVPASRQAETLARLQGLMLRSDEKALLFTYKLAFEAIG